MQQLVEQEAAIKSMQASTADAVAELREKLTQQQQQQQAAQQLQATLQVGAAFNSRQAVSCVRLHCYHLHMTSGCGAYACRMVCITFFLILAY
jgi:ubiquinone biosynthesis protein Coq4